MQQIPRGSWKEIRGNESLFLPSFSVVECVKKLYDDPELCTKLGENAYENIAKVHNRDRQAEDYLEILKGVVGK